MKKQIIFLFLISLSFPVLGSVNSLLINVKNYGAKGDGKSDDYLAIKKVFDLVNKNGGGEIFFPKGNYYIAQFHNGNNEVADLELKNCGRLIISGENAIISVMGHFHRKTNTFRSGRRYSAASAIIPFKISNCKNVDVSNLEIIGNVNETTRDNGVVESGGHLVLISNCTGVKLSRLSIHHGQTDGLYISGCASLFVNDVTCSNNGRQGMSIIKLQDATFSNCKFINTGVTEGKYGKHAPSAGVDIEPGTKSDTVRNVSFVNCLFASNLGSQFVCSTTALTDGIQLEKCIFNASLQSSRYTVIVNAKNVGFRNCEFSCQEGSIYPLWQTDGSSSSFTRCVIRSNKNGFVAVTNAESSSVVIDDCTIEYTGRQILQSYFPYIQMKNMTFVNNKIKIPAEYLKVKGPSALIQRAQKVHNNVFDSGKSIKLPIVSYTGSNLFNVK
jgi:hypothetical protein